MGNVYFGLSEYFHNFKNELWSTFKKPKFIYNTYKSCDNLNNADFLNKLRYKQ